MFRIALIVAFILSFSVTATAEDTHAYVGVKKCKMCHKGEKKGMMFETWSESSHAKAYANLGEQPAKDLYTKLGNEGNPQEDPACLKCHVTGYGEDEALTAKILIEEGVTCESCHGAGGDYFKMTVMKDRALAVANGMVDNPKEICVKCHNEENPAHKEFKYDERWEKIKHSTPEAGG